MLKNLSCYRTLRLGSVLVIGSLLVACSQVPDAINPVEWYNSGVDFFAGEATDQQTASVKTERVLKKNLYKTAAGDDKKFPKLTSVDQQRDYYEARKQRGLVADTEGRKYAPAIARQAEVSKRLAAVPPAEPGVLVGQPATAKDPAAEVGAQQSEPPPSASLIAEQKVINLPSESQQRVFQARLQKRLKDIRMKAGQQTVEMMTTAHNVIARDDFGTIIVNSKGVSAGQTVAGIPYQVAKNLTNINVGLQKQIAQSEPQMDGSAVKVATIHFRNGSSALTSRDRQIIASALQLQKERGGRIRIIGHASSRTGSSDPIRHKMTNLRVSVDRAEAVVGELMRLGAKKEELVVDAISDSRPVYHEFMPTGEAGNRRAEIYLEG
jgi:flagellar motor protein MotB